MDQEPEGRDQERDESEAEREDRKWQTCSRSCG